MRQYKNRPAQEAVITLESGKLFSFRGAPQALRLQAAASETSFYIWPLQQDLRFELDAQNQVSRLALGHGGSTFWFRPVR